jgi:flagellar biosynthesis/type III secretory pathway protein FliH
VECREDLQLFLSKDESERESGRKGERNDGRVEGWNDGREEGRKEGRLGKREKWRNCGKIKLKDAEK